MGEGFSLTDAQRAAFEEILKNKPVISAAVSKQEAKFDALNELIGSQKVLTEIKSKLPFSFSGQALFLCDAQNSKDVLMALCKFCFAAGVTPVLVLFGTNYKTVTQMLKEANFSGNFIILDCVSKSIAQVKDGDTIFFVDSLRNLTQMQIKILNIIEKNHRSAFVFDSIRALSLYHSEEVVTKFLYSLTKLLRNNNSPAHYILTEKKSASKLSQFFDEVIELKKFY